MLHLMLSGGPIFPMAKHKVLKSVAHNFGHAFTSLMNYGDDDYVMGHILRFARQSGQDTLTIDLVKREAGPPELMAPPVGAAVDRYAEWFWKLVEQHGSDRLLEARHSHYGTTSQFRFLFPALLKTVKARICATCASPTPAGRNIPPTSMGGGIR